MKYPKETTEECRARLLRLLPVGSVVSNGTT